MLNEKRLLLQAVARMSCPARRTGCGCSLPTTPPCLPTPPTFLRRSAARMLRVITRPSIAPVAAAAAASCFAYVKAW